MATLLVRHAVEDYDTWRGVYDDAESLRERHGCTEQRVLRAADGDDLLVLHEFGTLGQAQAFAGDPDLKAAMQKAGLAGPPRIEIYDEIG